MSEVAVFAPGKLFVIGEYAVLDGGRALVAAVDSGMECHLEPCATGWWLHAVDFGIDEPLAAVRRETGAGLLAKAVRAGSRTFTRTGPCRVTVQARGHGADKKIGLGASAASVVSILGALAAAEGRDLTSAGVRRALFATALDIHRDFQRGHGSGADVAASVYGGWLDYSVAAGTPRVVAAAVPADLLLDAAWSGLSADTGAGIEIFDRLRRNRTAGPLVAHLHADLARFWAALATGSRPELLGALDHYGSLLADLTRRIAPQRAERMAQLTHAAAGHGVVSKSSGAVGGDCVIALGFDRAGLAAARTSWLHLDATPLGVTIDVAGVRLIEAAG
ncbi:mevalonate kinase family protein [Streptomyces celluloflavus]|uniref:mevalonate kinase family protein n=1 Tax=Streptomyces celluloflavus TaxID=58344 RepID=UPI00367BAE18